ncbi:MAG: hypothetical protein KatS3mg068_1976 [Candidatus Sericytochromatia bacterium]|nr:MAG: hypothetical protein KatS3mg068_1976 [Candidatus Sericytochromatia bacterium]
MFKNVLVTGCSGSVGKFLVELLLEKGYNVVGIDKQNNDINSQNFKFIQGDITNKETVSNAMKGINAIVNTAAIVNISASFQELRAINFDAVKILYNEAKKNNVDYFIHFSTGSVYKASSEPHNENSEVELVNPYIQTKYMSEEFLRSQNEDKPIVNIIRPALIYGPRIRVLAAIMVTYPVLIKSFINFFPKIKGGAKSNWVYSEDVARACLFLLENPQPNNEIFNVANDDVLSIGEMLSIACQTYGIKLINFEIPISTKKFVKIISPFRNIVLKTINNITGSFWNKVINKYNISSPINTNLDVEFLDFAEHDTIFDNTKIKSLGFELKYPKFIDGWKQAINWYEDNKWIPNHKDVNEFLKYGISFYEKMYGRYVTDNNEEKKFNFSCSVKIPSIKDFFNDLTSYIKGKVEIDNTIYDNLEGKLIIDLLKKKKLIYDFNFGDNYRFYGTKNINYLNFVYSITHLEGIIYKNDNFLAKANLVFDLKELKSFLESFKIV